MFNVLAKSKIGGLLIFTLFVPGAWAQEKGNNNQELVKSFAVITSFDKEATEYRFDSFGDLYIGIDEISRELNCNQPKKSKGSCEVSIGVKMEMMDGSTKTTITGIVTTEYNIETINTIVKKLKDILSAVAI